MALSKFTEVSQIRVLAVPEQSDPDGNPMPDEWRVNVYAEVTYSDPEDPSVEKVTSAQVTTYLKTSNWANAEPEVRAICDAVFPDGTAFYPAPAPTTTTTA